MKIRLENNNCLHILLLQTETLWCGVRYSDVENSYHTQSSRYEGHFEEHVELDLQNGYYEKVEVPEFDECRRAVVVHDFHTVSIFSFYRLHRSSNIILTG